jgi:hypothetical protein
MRVRRMLVGHGVLVWGQLASAFDCEDFNQFHVGLISEKDRVPARPGKDPSRVACV